MKIKKFAAALLAALMLAGAATVTVSAETATVQAAAYGETLFAGDSVNRAIYAELKEKIKAVASSGGSTAFEISKTNLPDVSVTYDVGTETSTISNLLNQAVAEVVNSDLINQVLLADCPYELYWYDKSNDQALQFGYGYSYDATEAKLTSLTFTFRVAGEYQNNDAYDVKHDKTAIQTPNSVSSVIAEYSEKSDWEKLEAYKNYICNAVEYNTYAANSQNNVAYGNPWQLIWVFDSDETNKVVCEGYAKAFKYLCDLSTFKSKDFACYLVTGELNNGAHMWNIVTLDGINYHVDVTNSDIGSVGQDGELYMSVAPTTKGNNYYSTADTAFTFVIDANNSAEYSYDAKTIALYTAGILKLGPMLGDIDDNGTIDDDDIKLILAHLRGETKLTDDALIRADYNRDGKVNARDCILMMRNRTN